jgi:multiple sugar transport system ATP-binding protein
MLPIILESLTKRFGEVIAVRDLSLSIEPGEFVTLLGPSGCGKSTTLNMLAGLETVDEGVIYFGDVPVNELPPKDRDVAMVFQNYALYPHMSVFDNIAFPLKARKLSPDEVQKMVQGVAATLGIGNLLGRLPKELSGGQRQRVALGRAIVRSPKAFLMDEPLSNLDAKLRIQMRAELRHLHDTLKTTTVYVTHDQAEAMTLSDRIAVLNEGILQQVGTPTQVYQQPSNVFVAGFLGSYPMNFVEGSIRIRQNACIEWDGLQYGIAQDLARRLADGASSERVIVGIRPEHTRVALSPEPNAIRGEIFVVEQMGSDALVLVETSEAQFMARMEPTFPGQAKDPAWVCLDPEKLLIFDADTENALFQA